MDVMLVIPKAANDMMNVGRLQGFSVCELSPTFHLHLSSTDLSPSPFIYRPSPFNWTFIHWPFTKTLWHLLRLHSNPSSRPFTMKFHSHVTFLTLHFFFLILFLELSSSTFHSQLNFNLFFISPSSTFPNLNHITISLSQSPLFPVVNLDPLDPV